MASNSKQYSVEADVKIQRLNTGGVVESTPYDDPLRATGAVEENLFFDLDLTHPTVDKSLSISDVSPVFVYLKSCDTAAPANPAPVNVKFDSGDAGTDMTSAIIEGSPAEILLSTVDKDLRVQVWIGGKD